MIHGHSGLSLLRQNLRIEEKETMCKFLFNKMKKIFRRAPRINKGKGITIESDEDPLKKLVPASTIVRPNPDEEVKVTYMIIGKMCYFTDTEMNNDKKNFDVHQPFKFTEFGITEFDEMGPIIQKKKNSIVKDLMTSLSKRYKWLTKILEKLRIQSVLPALVLEQASSQTLGRKRKHMELEPEVKVPGLERNRSLPEGVPFANNMVIEEPEYWIFFMDVFGAQAFQRWNDIHKGGVDSLVLYLVMASMVKTKENARFSQKLRKLITDHPDQENLKSKKVKLEELGYQIDCAPLWLSLYCHL
nr:hypothetical protein [Tanacetum cinerariifolium]